MAPLITNPTNLVTIGKFVQKDPGDDVFQVLDKKGNVVLHMNSDGFLDPPTDPQEAIVTVSSAQLLALHTTPVTIVPAPGSNQYIVPHSYSGVYLFKGTPYTISGGNNYLYLGWPGNDPFGLDSVGFFQETGFLDQPSSQLFVDASFASTGPVPLSVVLGKPYQLSTPDTLTLGNGELIVTLSYTVVQL